MLLTLLLRALREARSLVVTASERRKGLVGEAEVAALYRLAGFEWRGLEAEGDGLALGFGTTHHVEVKRQEVARPWAWQVQAVVDAPPHTLPVVAFRRSRSPWWAMTPLDELLAALVRARLTA